MILLILATAISLHKSEGMNSRVTVYTADTEKLNPIPNVQYKDNKPLLQRALICSKAKKRKTRGVMVVIPQVFTIKKGSPPQGNLLPKCSKICYIREQPS